MLGAPIPDHVVELMHRGRLADGSRMRELLGIAPLATTPEVIDRLYAWEDVVRIVPDRSVGLMADVVPLRSGDRRGARASRVRHPVVEVDAVTDVPRTIGWRPTFEVDDWGRDAWLIRALEPLGRLRWHVSVGGAQHVPADGPALLVANARRFSLSSVYAVLGAVATRPVAPCASSAAPTSPRSGRSCGASVRCSTGPTRWPTPCATARSC